MFNSAGDAGKRKVEESECWPHLWACSGWNDTVRCTALPLLNCFLLRSRIQKPDLQPEHRAAQPPVENQGRGSESSWDVFNIHPVTRDSFNTNSLNLMHDLLCLCVPKLYCISLPVHLCVKLIKYRSLHTKNQEVVCVRYVLSEINLCMWVVYYVIVIWPWHIQMTEVPWLGNLLLQI